MFLPSSWSGLKMPRKRLRSLMLALMLPLTACATPPNVVSDCGAFLAPIYMPKAARENVKALEPQLAESTRLWLDKISEQQQLIARHCVLLVASASGSIAGKQPLPILESGEGSTPASRGTPQNTIPQNAGHKS